MTTDAHSSPHYRHRTLCILCYYTCLRRVGINYQWFRRNVRKWNRGDQHGSIASRQTCITKSITQWTHSSITIRRDFARTESARMDRRPRTHEAEEKFPAHDVLHGYPLREQRHRHAQSESL